MTERIRQIKEEVTSVHPEICVDRAILITEAYRATEGEPVVIRRAKALKKILEEMPIYIQDGELLVGNQGHKPRSAPIFPEYSWDWILNEIDQFDKRHSDRFIISEEDKQKLRKSLKYWKGKTVKDRALNMQPEEVKLATKNWCNRMGGECNCR